MTDATLGHFMLHCIKQGGIFQNGKDTLWRVLSILYLIVIGGSARFDRLRAK